MLKKTKVISQCCLKSHFLATTHQKKKNKTIANLPKIQDALKRNKMRVGWLWPFTLP
jgi:hypothetical protein